MDRQRGGDAVEAGNAQGAMAAFDAADLALRQADAAAQLGLGDALGLADITDPHRALGRSLMTGRHDTCPKAMYQGQ